MTEPQRMLLLKRIATLEKRLAEAVARLRAEDDRQAELYLEATKQASDELYRSFKLVTRRGS